MALEQAGGLLNVHGRASPPTCRMSAIGGQRVFGFAPPPTSDPGGMRTVRFRAQRTTTERPRQAFSLTNERF